MKDKVYRVKHKYQVLIPPEVREKLDIEEGDYINYDVDSNGNISIKKVDISIEK